MRWDGKWDGRYYDEIYIYFQTISTYHLIHHIISTIISSHNRKIYGSDLLIFISSYSSLFSNYDQFPTPKVRDDEMVDEMVDNFSLFFVCVSLSLSPTLPSHHQLSVSQLTISSISYSLFWKWQLSHLTSPPSHKQK